MTPAYADITVPTWTAAGGHATVEVTSFCDLRCLYCYQSDPNFVRRKADQAVLENIISQFCKLGVPEVTLTGAGEITTHKGWEKLVAMLRSAGISYTLTTNFSRRYSVSEIDALAAASQLTISFDTHDPELHAKIRRRSDLSVIFENLLRVVSRSKETGHKPYINNNVVVSYETVTGLPAMAEKAKGLGIDRVALLYMLDGQKLEGSFRVTELMTPSGEIKNGVLESLSAFRAAAEANDLDIFVSQIIADMENVPTMPLVETIPRDVTSPTMCEAAPATTRLCVAPWRTVYVTTQGKVGPCCLLSDYLGTLENQTVSEAVRSDRMVALQQALWRGRLETSSLPAANDVCAKCCIYPRGSVETLAAMVRGPPSG
jgi:MoaA/NifB/PqqE/SkfB family radical SAM enzyme